MKVTTNFFLHDLAAGVGELAERYQIGSIAPVNGAQGETALLVVVEPKKR